MKTALVTADSGLFSRLRIAALLGVATANEIIELPQPLQQAYARLRRERPALLVVQTNSSADELTLLESLTAENPALQVIMLDAQQSPEFLMRAMRSGVREVLPLPLEEEGLAAAFARVARRAEQAQAPERQAEIFAFVPVKGGAGATFVASNVAHLLATKFNKRVVLIDLNLPFGEAETYVTTDIAQHCLADVAEKTSQLDEAMLGSALLKVTPNFGILPTGDQLERSVAISAEQITAVIDTAAGIADYVFLDVTSSINALTLAALDRATHIVPVMEASFPVIRNGKRLMDLFRRLGYTSEKIQPVINRFDSAGQISVGDIEKALGLAVRHTLVDRAESASASVNQGVPLSQLKPRDPLTRQLTELAAQWVPNTEAVPSTEAATSALVSGLRARIFRFKGSNA